MNESMVTFQGWLGGDVRTRQAAGAVVANFRVASTPRRFQRATGEWSDGPTQWYTVNAWRSLGEHCAASLRRGEPVVVHGRLTQSTWINNEGIEVSSLEVEAVFVGHDLNRGRTSFTRAAARQQPATTGQTPSESTATGPGPAQPSPVTEPAAVTGWVA